jgi:DNA-binding Lrp family transcriptional regulator
MNARIDLSESDKKIIKRLQGDLPIVPNPYHAIADELGIPVASLLERVAFFQANGLLKRLGAVIRHQNAGFAANALVVWSVPPNDVECIGALFAAQPFVSHCYQRDPMPDFPYTLYAMIHAASEDECSSHAETLSRLADTSDYQALFSLKEFKKSSMQYF